MKIQDIIKQATNFLKEVSPSPRLDAEIIISDILKCRREDLYTRFSEDLLGKQLQECLVCIERRIQGEPVAYITGKKDFFNHTFFVEKGVLVPRPETELLVEYALHWIEEDGLKENLWVLDLGCGTGCIGISLLKEVFRLHVVAVDISETAISLTKKNAQNLNVLDKIITIQKNADDLTEDDLKDLKEHRFSGKFDIIISNPPYISYDDQNVQEGVRKHEPHEALFCKDGGLEKIKKWTQIAGEHLKPQGLWIFEIGSQQGQGAQEIVWQNKSFQQIQKVQDYAGLDRFIIAIKS